MARDRTITINVDGYEKRGYQHWAIDNAGGNMAKAILLFVQWIVETEPVWSDIVDMLKASEEDTP